MEPKMAGVIGTGSCVVDRGCVSGRLLSALAERFDQRIGLDVSRTRLDTLADGEIDGWEFREVGILRRLLDRQAANWPVREFLSENILLWAEK